MNKRLGWRRLCGLAFAAAIVIPSSSASGQVHEKPTQAPAQNTDVPTATRGGSSTAGVFAPVLDSEHRPITAGGFVKTGPIVFEDISAKAGLTSWHHIMG